MSSLMETRQAPETKTDELLGKALVLDFGSVISRSVFERREEIAIRLGVPVASLTFFGPLNPNADAHWTAMLADEMTEREYWALMAKSVGELLGKDWKPLDFLQAAKPEDVNNDIRPEIISLIRRAKLHGAKVGVLSNELELFYGAEVLKGVEILKEVDKIVDATHTRILKPDPRAYEQVLAELCIKAEDAVFVDDQPRNVEGSEAFGMQAIFFDVRDPKGTCDKVWRALLAL